MGQHLVKYYQDGTNAPLPTVIRNSAGLTITYTRAGEGEYYGTISPALPAGSYVLRHNVDPYLEKTVDATVSDGVTLGLRTFENGTMKDDLFPEIDFILEIVTP